MRSLDSNNDNDREKRPKPVDAHVGSRIRLRRTILSMTQERLADALGLTFQQVQKYERGANRVGASRLFDLARVLDVPISFFFDDLPETAVGTDPGAPRRRMLSGFTQESPGDEPTSRRQTLELARAFNGITDAAVRKRVLDLIRSCS